MYKLGYVCTFFNISAQCVLWSPVEWIASAVPPCWLWLTDTCLSSVWRKHLPSLLHHDCTTFVLHVNHNYFHIICKPPHTPCWPVCIVCWPLFSLTRRTNKPHFENTSPRKHNRNWKTQLTCSCNCKMPERTRPDRGAITSKFADHPSNPGVSTTQCQSVD